MELLAFFAVAVFLTGAAALTVGLTISSRRAWRKGHRQGYQQGVIDRPELEMDDE